MKIINKSNVPEALFKYLSIETYDFDEKGDSLSATEILKPIQVVVLKRRYWDKLVVDAIDRLWIMLGNGVHKILDEEEGIVPIERLKVKVGKRDLSGKWDRIIENEITDYKVTSAWTIYYDRDKKDWLKQLSIYRWLFWKVKGVLLKDVGYIVALLRDWSEKNTKTPGYPTSPAVQIPFTLLSMEETERIVTRRVNAITMAESLKDKDLPECSAEDRWYDEKKKIYRRCNSYCDVSVFCQQYKRDPGEQK